MTVKLNENCFRFCSQKRNILGLSSHLVLYFISDVYLSCYQGTDIPQEILRNDNYQQLLSGSVEKIANDIKHGDKLNPQVRYVITFVSCNKQPRLSLNFFLTTSFGWCYFHRLKQSGYSVV